MTAHILTSRFLCSVFATVCMIWQQMFSCCACCSQPDAVQAVGESCCSGCSVSLEKTPRCCHAKTATGGCCGEESTDGNPCSGTCCQGDQPALLSSVTVSFSWFVQSPAVCAVLERLSVVGCSVGLCEFHSPPLNKRLAALCVWRN